MQDVQADCLHTLIVKEKHLELLRWWDDRKSSELIDSWKGTGNISQAVHGMFFIRILIRSVSHSVNEFCSMRNSLPVLKEGLMD